MNKRVAVVLAVTALATVPAAGASNATPAEVAALAARAVTDGGALAALRQVKSIDGRPVDLAAALPSPGRELDVRLRLLAAPARTGASAVTGLDPRATADAILAERRFRGSSVPRPLHRPLAWLGRKLHSIYRSVSRALPGGADLFWTLLGAAVSALAALVALQLARRRAGRLLETGSKPGRGSAESARQLEREADEAERNGDFELALRLRFRAGLLRLARAEAIPRRLSLTNGEIARRLESQSFRLLATDFDEVVYGRRPALGEDVTRARDAWQRVLEEAGTR